MAGQNEKAARRRPEADVMLRLFRRHAPRRFLQMLAGQGQNPAHARPARHAVSVFARAGGRAQARAVVSGGFLQEAQNVGRRADGFLGLVRGGEVGGASHG
nr:MAG TPA: hypothetical protein [Caudoviricetes sp.]